MTLWQDGREVKTYPIGVGLREYPIYIGRLQARTIEWNPVWIPPSSDWIEASTKVKAGEIIRPTDPRNPLGKVKIPLGYGYLIHQAKGIQDMGSLVSHGCIRVMQNDLYDLAEKIVAAQELEVSEADIAAAKRSKRKTVVAKIERPITVEITYDTVVIENGILHIYPDVYQYNRNTIESVRAELRSSGVSDRRLSDSEIRRILGGVSGKRKFVVSTDDIRNGRAIRAGRYIPVVETVRPPAKRKTPPDRRR
jgi:hypothetical protein